MRSLTIFVGKRTFADALTFTPAQAFALSLVFNVANWACNTGRVTRVDDTGRHTIGTVVANDLIKRGLLRDALERHSVLPMHTWLTKLRITRKGEQAVRAMQARGWDLEWLQAHQRETKAERFERKFGRAAS